jgi:CBS domain-containing protein
MTISNTLKAETTSTNNGGPSVGLRARCLPDALSPDHRRLYVGNLLVRNVMAQSVATLREDSLLSVAVHRMLTNKLDFLPVCSGTQVVGVVSANDIPGGLAHEGVDCCYPAQAAVGNVMSTSFVSCSAHDTVREAARVMDDSLLKQILVLDETKHLLGMLRVEDIVAKLVAFPQRCRTG